MREGWHPLEMIKSFISKKDQSPNIKSIKMGDVKIPIEQAKLPPSKSAEEISPWNETNLRLGGSAAEVKVDINQRDIRAERGQHIDVENKRRGEIQIEVARRWAKQNPDLILSQNPDASSWWSEAPSDLSQVEDTEDMNKILNAFVRSGMAEKFAREYKSPLVERLIRDKTKIEVIIKTICQRLEKDSRSKVNLGGNARVNA